MDLLGMKAEDTAIAVTPFIGGWYGSMRYIGSAAALPQAQLPYGANFMMGARSSASTSVMGLSAGGRVRVISANNAAVQVITKDWWREESGPPNVFVVAVNAGYQGQRATLSVPALATHKIRRLVVLCEERTVDVAKGTCGWRSSC